MKRRNFVYYSRFNKALLHACGALPIKTSNYLVNIALVLTPFLTSGFLSLPAFYSLIFRWNRLAAIEKMDILSEHIEIIVGAIKVFVLIPKREKIFGLTRSCENLWKNVVLDDDFVAVEPYATRSLYLTYGFAVNVFTAFVSLLVTPLFANFTIDTNGTVLVSKQLPYTAGIYHDNVKRFKIWHILQIPAGFVSIVPIIAVDTATAFFVLHACAHMTLCQKFFQNITVNFTTVKLLSILESERSLERPKIFKDIVRCVRHHQNVLRYAEDVENIFAPVVLIQTLLSISAICGFCYSLLVSFLSIRRVNMQLKFVKSKKGGKLLIANGFMYSLHREYREKVHWRCLQYTKNDCRGRCHTTDATTTGILVFLILLVFCNSREEELKGRVRYVIHLIGGAVQLLIFCWPPDNLQDESIKVADAAYNLPWYDWTTKEGKLVGMIIARSQKPASMTAGRFAIISLETFSSILSTAFSMFTLLLRVLE